MSKMVVGMNNRPEIRPQTIDCGLRNTAHIALPALLTQLLRGASDGTDGWRFGMNRNNRIAMGNPRTPINIQKLSHCRPAAMAGPTMNWPAEPPAMPNIWVAPISVAARDAGK